MHGTPSSPSHAPFDPTGLDAPVWPPPSTHAPPHAPHEVLPLTPSSLVGAIAGLLGLGAAAGLGAFDAIAGLRMIPSVLLVELGSLALTTPALLALHQFLGLHADVEALASALARALVRGGQVAAGLIAVVLGFAVTTDLAIPALIAALFAVGVFTSVVGCVELSAVERRATPRPRFADDPRFTALLIGWVILSWLIALRIGVHVARWVMGY
ncbi:hypothetical protein ACNOYE_32605 [Nannocystaceae bacterium ST9]